MVDLKNIKIGCNHFIPPQNQFEKSIAFTYYGVLYERNLPENNYFNDKLTLFDRKLYFRLSSLSHFFSYQYTKHLISDSELERNDSTQRK